MKANTPELMKFKRLQRRLGETRRGTIGLLESLWIEVSRNCPEGDVGRFSDEEIAIMVDWEGEPIALVNALVECGWLDQCHEHRLVVHDWADHCPTYVRGGLAKRGKVIAKAVQVEAIGTTSEVQPIGSPNNRSACTLEVASTKPIQANPNQAKSILSTQAPPKAEVERPDDVCQQTWEDWKIARKAKRAGPITESAMSLIRSESNRAGKTLEEAIAMAAGSGWITFKAEYVSGGQSPKTFRQIKEENTQRAIREFVGHD